MSSKIEKSSAIKYTYGQIHLTMGTEQQGFIVLKCFFYNTGCFRKIDIISYSNNLTNFQSNNLKF